MGDPAKFSVYNALDIPMVGARLAFPIEYVFHNPYSLPSLTKNHRKLVDGMQFLRSEAPSHKYATQVHEDPFNWGMIASPWAISDTHFDASGFGSFINLHKGRKLWALGLLKIKPGQSVRDRAALFADISALNFDTGWLNENFDWQIIVLNEGDSM